jgi:serine/threonine protein kinase
MQTVRTSNSREREERLTAVLLAYLEAVEAGEAPDRRRWLARHAEFAAELKEFFANRDEVERVAVPLREAVRAALPVPRAAAGESAPLGQLGDFCLLREIGRGGMGVVYEARQISLNRRVALKVLPFAAALDARQLQRFQNEAQAAAHLHHPNIVPVHAVGCERGVHYYAMQFIEGQSLAALIEELRRPAAEGSKTAAPADAALVATREHPGGVVTVLSSAHAAGSQKFFRDVARLVQMAAEGLEQAHQLGIVHRDIKPANLLLDGRGNLWVTDFGLAQIQSATGPTLTGDLVGTLRYMSPEQTGARQEPVDHRTDLYALGVTFYELLTLKPCFETQDRHALLAKIAAEEPRPPRAVDRRIPVELETIVLKAIAKAPAERYASAREMADDLGRFLADQPILARRPTLVDRVIKWSRRHQPEVIIALALSVALVAALAASTVLVAREQAKTKSAYEDARAAEARERQRALEALEQKERAEASFQQARQAVDYFVRFGEEGLGDRPLPQWVHCKLLETALVYYQDFIEQRRNDPSVRADLLASQQRIERILRELALLQGVHELEVLTDDAVERELGLSTSQVERITTILAQAREQRAEAFRDYRWLSPEEQRRRFKEAAEERMQAVADVLRPVQNRRLGEIMLQHQGVFAFSDPDVARTLGLGAGQRQRIRAILDGFTPAGPKRPGADERTGKRQTGLEQVLALLTPEQQARWRAMTGEPFKAVIHTDPLAWGPDHPPPPPSPPFAGEDHGPRPGHHHGPHPHR